MKVMNILFIEKDPIMVQAELEALLIQETVLALRMIQLDNFIK